MFLSAFIEKRNNKPQAAEEFPPWMWTVIDVLRSITYAIKYGC